MTRNDILTIWICSIVVFGFFMLGLSTVLMNIEENLEIIAQHCITREVEE